MIWFLYAPINYLLMLFCYITNPIVLLFCDEAGELPKYFRLWQTWDDSCNPKFYIEKVPKFLRYNYDKHYVEYWAADDRLKSMGRNRCYAKVIDPKFTLKERIQRYICRVMWLSRNCAYGFAFYAFGRNRAGSDLVAIRERSLEDGQYIHFYWDKHENIFTRTWSLKTNWHINKNLRWEVYAGWKIDPSSQNRRQCMIAVRVAFRFIRQKKH